MCGLNGTDETFSYDNRPWWFRDHLKFPPNDEDVLIFLLASQINDLCSNSGPHTKGFDDLYPLCAYYCLQNDAREVKVEDFTVFSVNRTRVTNFQVPARMPLFPPRLIEAESRVNRHEVSNFRINYTNCFEWSLTGTVPVSAPNVPRRCGADTANGKWHTPLGTARTEPSSHYPGFGRRLTTCSTYSPPVYTDLYEFEYRPQDDIFTIHSSSPWDYT
ncbi:hypothetical protein C8J57DRAFT_1431920 [Mycena rebaudengoi]|nr:hypothetical protein C8J57DRAFT_1431920 [Mycena rebaudengoi]